MFTVKVSAQKRYTTFLRIRKFLEFFFLESKTKLTPSCPLAKLTVKSSVVSIFKKTSCLIYFNHRFSAHFYLIINESLGIPKKFQNSRDKIFAETLDSQRPKCERYESKVLARIEFSEFLSELKGALAKLACHSVS